MPFPDDITAIIVNYNSGHIINKSLEHLTALKHIIVVDNASQDDSVAGIERDYPGVTIVRNKRNLGYGSGVNCGLRLVKTRYVLTVSPDTELDIDVLRCMFETIEADDQAGVVAPALETQGQGIEIWAMGPHETVQRKMDINAVGNFCGWFLSAAVALYRSEALNKIGGFDENIFLYNEDLDLSIRLTKAKYAMIMLPNISAKHVNSGSAPPSVKLHWRKDWNFAWGHLYLQKKHVGRWVAVRKAWGTIALRAPKALLYLLTFDRKRLIRDGATTMGAISFLLGRTPNPSD